MAVEADIVNFGIEKDYEYSGHITQANHLVPLPRRTYASSDETHFRIWRNGGDIVKKRFAGNRRGMVCALTFCPTYNVLLSAEVDMTVKAYSTITLDTLETFTLEELRKGDAGRRASEKTSAMGFLQNHNRLVIGGDAGLELWELVKSNHRRAVAIAGFEHHLQLEFVRALSSAHVFNILVEQTENRILVWGPRHFDLYDLEMNLVVCYDLPPALPIRCASLRVASLIETLLLLGGEDGTVNFFSVQGSSYAVTAGVVKLDDSQLLKNSGMRQPLQQQPRQEQQQRASRLPSVKAGEKSAQQIFVRQEHTFHAHARSVELVSFYDRGASRRLSVSHGRDGKMKVWNLVNFALVYALDFHALDVKASAFSIGLHVCAIGAMIENNATLTLYRFTSNVAVPLATTNQSPVVLISTPPLPPADRTFTNGSLNRTKGSHACLWDTIVLTSEDMAIRVVDGMSSQVISTLPPPPNSKVHVLDVFFCPVWQLLLLWLSSEEIAIFFVPKARDASEPTGDSRCDKDRGLQRATNSSTPLLLRRFSVLEVRTAEADKHLREERFSSMALHYGCAPQRGDYVLPRFGIAAGDEKGSRTSDWFLFVGTSKGTVHVHAIRDILHDCRIWKNLSDHLPPGSFASPTERSPSEVTQPENRNGVDVDIRSLEPVSQQERAQAIAEKQREIELMTRTAGQRPFPRGASQILIYARHRFHEYLVRASQAMGSRLLTIDIENNMQMHEISTMEPLLSLSLGTHSCRTLCAHRSGAIDFQLAGLVVGLTNGCLQLVAFDEVQSPTEVVPVMIQSRDSHSEAPIQIAFTWPANMFASVGADDTVKLWSCGLLLLKEIVFPQSLTSVAFRTQYDGKLSDDSSRDSVHGDVLVGFASHVESISYEFWSRGILSDMLGTPTSVAALVDVAREQFEKAANSMERKTPVLHARKSIGRRTGTVKSSEFSDNIELWHAYFEQVVGEASGRLGDVEDEAATSSGSADDSQGRREISHPKDVKLTPPVSLGDADDTSSVPSPKRWVIDGVIADFRGKARMDVGTLSGRVADTNAAALRHVCPVDYVHRSTVDKATFQGITRSDLGYYDWTVNPIAFVDAPRATAVRGTCSSDGVAVVNSLGLGHLRSQSLSSLKGSSSKDNLIDAVGSFHLENVQVTLPSTQRASPRPPTMAQRRKRSPPPSDAATISDSEDEHWRNQRIARGVPARESCDEQPRSQNSAGTEVDAMRLLCERGHFIEALPPRDDNFLKNAFLKKQDWLYCTHDDTALDHDVAARRKLALEALKQEKSQKKKALGWNSKGRFVPPEEFCCLALPAVPNNAFGGCRTHREKTAAPITRSELTDQRIIEQAKQISRPVVVQAYIGAAPSQRMRRGIDRPRTSFPLSAR